MAFDVWPIALLSPRNVRFSPSSGAARSGGRTLNGSARMTTWQAGGLWRGTYFQIPVVTPEKILLAEAIEALLDSGAEPMAIPRLPGLRAPQAASGGSVPHSDDTPFEDGALYGPSALNGTLDADAQVFATTLSFSWPGLSHLVGGDFEVMAPEGPRLHRIKRFLDRSGTAGAYTYDVEISPPLRCDLAVGAVLNFVDPHCLMRLANPEAFAATLEMNRWGFIDAEFVEA